jgi:AcrR family transcriptional regulator
MATREEQIIEHALELFSEGGYRETSLQEIADRLGITRPAFYHYFKSKDDLLWKLVGPLGKQLLLRAEPIAAGDEPPVEKLRQLLESHVQTLVDNWEGFKIYFNERHRVASARSRTLNRAEEKYLALLAEVIAAGQDDGSFRVGSPRFLAYLVKGFANSVLHWYRPDGDLSGEEVSSITAQTIVAGLCASDGDFGDGAVLAAAARGASA